MLLVLVRRQDDIFTINYKLLVAAGDRSSRTEDNCAEGGLSSGTAESCVGGEIPSGAMLVGCRAKTS